MDTGRPQERKKEIKTWEGTIKIIGYKRALVFYLGSHLVGVKTNWIMHEFRVAADHIVNDNNKRVHTY